MKKILFIAGGILLITAGILLGRMICGSCTGSVCPAAESAKISAVSFTMDNPASVIQMKVEQVIGSEKKSEKLKAAIMKVNGVEKVSTCTESGTVTIRFDHVATGGIDPVTAAVRKAGFKYEMAGVSSCCKAKAKSAGKSCEPKKSCTGTDKEI